MLIIALPLIISTGSWSLQHFVDRIFLTWYGRDALAAALPAGILNFTFGSFFLGIAGYVNTFVAQYSGAGRETRVGASVWQGIYFSLGAGVLQLGFIPLAGPLFDWVGHPPAIRELEVTYFRVLCLVGGPAVMMSALSSFFTGRGDTKTVMWVNLGATVMNVALDYAWIFGNWGFPEWGIAGAAAATVVAHGFGAVVLVILVFRKPFRDRFATLRAWRFDPELLRRMLRYGIPNGVQFTLEVGGFTLFILLVGRLGTVELSATNIAFNINTLAFLPMLGVGLAISTLVGRYIGSRQPDLAETATWSGLHLSLAYMVFMALLYVLVPNLLLKPYRLYADPEAFEPVFRMVVSLLYFVAVFSIFDAVVIVLSSALKGAGDTAYVMVLSVACNWGLFVVPVYISIAVLGFSLYVAWIFPTVYLLTLSAIFYVRFKRGRWRTMRVIEAVDPTSGDEREY